MAKKDYSAEAIQQRQILERDEFYRNQKQPQQQEDIQAPQVSGGAQPFTPSAPPSIENLPKAKPYLAFDVTSQGIANYGSGFRGWLRKSWADLTDPDKYKQDINLLDSDTQEDILSSYNGRIESWSRIIEKTTKWSDWGEKVFGLTSEEIAAMPAGLSTERQITQELSKQEGDTELEATARGLGTLASRAVRVNVDTTQNAIWGGLEVLSLGDKLMRKVNSVVVGVDRVSDKLSPDEPQNFFQKATSLGAFSFAKDVFTVAQGIRDGKITYGDVETSVKEVLASSDMVYSLAWDTVARAEFEKAMAEGEDPHQIAMEYGRAGYELLGSIAFDPATYLGASILKPVNLFDDTARIGADTFRFFGKTVTLPWKTIGKIPTFGEIIGANIGKTRLAKAGDRFTELAIPELKQILSKTENIQDERAAIKVMEEAVQAVTKKVDDMRTHRRWWNLASVDSHGKVRRASSDADYFIKSALNRYGLNDTLQMLRDMTKLRKGGQEGLDAARKLMSRTDMAFTNVGMMVGEIVSRLDNDNVFDAIKKTKNAGETHRVLFDSLEKAISDLIPSVDEMLDAERRLNAGEELTPKLRELAEMAKDVPSVVKTINRITRPVEKVTKGVTGGMVQLFMNLVPRAWARNIYGQSVLLAMATDMKTAISTSIEAFVASPIKKFSGNVLENTNASIVKKLGFSPIEASIGIQDALDAGKKTRYGFLPAMQRSEQITAANIINKVVDDEIQKALPVVLDKMPEYEELARIMPKEEMAVFQVALKRAGGNFDDAMQIFRDTVGKGEIEAWRLAEPSEDMRKHLVSMNMLDEFYDAQKSAQTPDDFQKFIDDFAAVYDLKVTQAAENLPSTLRSMPEELYDFGDDLGKHADPANINLMAELIQSWQNTNRQLGETVYQVLAQADLASRTNPQMAEVVALARQKIHEFEGAASATYEAINSLRSQVKKTVDVVNKNTPQEEIISLWNKSINYRGKKFKLSEIYKDIDPKTLNPKTFKSRLWTAFFETSADLYRSGNNATYSKTLGVLEEMATGLGTDLTTLAQAKQKGTNPFQVLVKMQKQAEDIESAVSWRRFLNQFNFDEMPTKPDGSPIMLKDVVGKFQDVFSGWKGGQKHIVNAVNADYIKSQKYSSLGEEFVNTVLRVKEKAKNLKEKKAAVTPPEVQAYITEQAERITEITKNFGKAQREARKAGTGAVKLTYDNATQYIQTLPMGEAVTLDKLKNAASYGVEIRDEIVKFIEASGGSASRRDLLEFVAALELGKNPSLPQKAGFIPYEEITLEQAYRAIFNRTRVPPEDGAIHEARILWETKDEFISDVKRWGENVVNEWGATVKTTKADNADAMRKFRAAYEAKMKPIRETAGRIAVETRDFVLHDYDRTYLDHALTYLFGNSFHYWTTRTYSKMFENLLDNPKYGAAYLAYKDYLTKEHAGMPEFYRQNVVVDNLLGLDLNNPYYVNLEAMINPMYGLTGTDFNDPRKRVDWMTRMVDDAGKMGMGFSPLVQWSIATKLYMEGEDGAAQRWLGRLLPQSQIVKSGSAALFGKAIEIDPFVQLSNQKFLGGVDAYERNRVVAAMAMMVQNGEITQEEMIEAARMEDGDIWNRAIQLSAEKRFSGDVASFFVGVGARPRTQEDMVINKFWGDYSTLLASKSLMTPDQYRQAWEGLKENPEYGRFVDGLLLSRKSGDEQQTAYAYNVLSRIPPGQMMDISRKANITPAMIEAFYNAKGDFSKMNLSPQDMARFQAGLEDIGYILAIPENATRQEWTEAKRVYGEMKVFLQGQYGEDIFDKINQFYDLDDTDLQEQYLDAHPEVEEALTQQQYISISNPTLNKYYGGFDTTERYLTTLSNKELERKYGEETVNKEQEYYSLLTSKERKAFENANPDFKAYLKEKKEKQKEIEERLKGMQFYVPPSPELQGNVPMSETQEALSQQIPQAPPMEFWQQQFGDALYEHMMDYMNGAKISSYARRELEYKARELGMSYDELVAYFRGSVVQSP